jgi:hypothetical protein
MNWKTVNKAGITALGMLATVSSFNILPEPYSTIVGAVLSVATVLGVHYTPYHGIYRVESPVKTDIPSA